MSTKYLKHIILTAAVMLLLLTMMISTWRTDIWTFNRLCYPFAIYGFVSFGLDILHWLSLPDRVISKPQRKRGKRQHEKEGF